MVSSVDVVLGIRVVFKTDSDEVSFILKKIVGVKKCAKSITT